MGGDDGGRFPRFVAASVGGASSVEFVRAGGILHALEDDGFNVV